MRREHGATLLLCVVLLAALSLLGVSAASDAFLQERMGANRAASETALRLADARLRALEQALWALPGATRPSACPLACLPALPPDTLLEELALLPADEVLGRPEVSYFLLSAQSEPGTSPAAMTRSIMARPWGDAAWTGDRAACALLDPSIACGRQAWESAQP